ncbi:MAG: LytTR family DNA-binding domain-containing protein [Oscillospiraceae bacterium]
MHIAICDDDASELARVLSLLDTYRQERAVCLTYQAYHSAAELLATMKNGQYALLLLDILMPGFTGIEAAREVRTFDQGVRIIFLTSSPEFALDSYAVKAQDYMLKPVPKEKLFSALDAIFAEEQTPMEGLVLKTQSGMARILFSRLAFVEITNKRLHFHLSDGSMREAYASLAEYEKKLLSQPGFIKVHRAYIVNLWQMSELTASSFVSNSGKVVPISRLLYGEVRKAYMEHLFVETGAQ